MAYQRLMITSHRGGTGCSTVAVAMAKIAHEMGLRVVLCDLDLTSRTLDMHLGLEDRVVYDIGDLLYHRASPKDVAVPVNEETGFYLIPGMLAGGNPTPLQLEKALGDIEGALRPDLMILDAKGACVPRLAPLVDASVTPMTPGEISLRSCSDLAAHLRENGCKDLYILPNFCSEDNPLDLRDMIDRTGMKLIGILPNDPKVHALPGEKFPGSEKSLYGAAIRRVTQRLLGHHIPLLAGSPWPRRYWLDI